MPSESPTPAWSDDDLRADANPHAEADKAKRVEQMFSAIAHAYDLNNRLHSMWRDQAWRRAAVRMAELKPDDVVLDVACGTGDLTFEFGKALRELNKPDTFDMGQVVGVDFTHAMLVHAKDKARSIPWPWLPKVSLSNPVLVNPARFNTAVGLTRGDAMRLPVADKSVDVISIAFGIRNVADPLAAMGEFYRVLRPGGRVIILEFSTPTNPVIRFFDRIYREKVMPITASLIARDKSGAYKYLPKSVSTFIDRAGMVEMMQTVGFKDPTIKPLTFGVAVCYRGMKT